MIDRIDDGAGKEVPVSSHKLGGRPYCIQEPELPGADELLTDGWTQVLQLDFPARSPVRGAWPFLDGLFNVFMRRDSIVAPSVRGARWAFQK